MVLPWQRLKQLGVLGINARVGRFMNPLNQRKDYPKVDDKHLTAELAEASGVPTPRTYGVFSLQSDLKKLKELLDNLESFVIKPARGAMGNGIIVIGRKTGDLYEKTSGKTLQYREIKYHASQIISGMYALSGLPDKVIVQEKISLHPVFARLAFQGIPDMRIIVFKGRPVMAMLRLPTRESDGRANLHQGAVGVGINMQTGRTTTAIHHNRLVTQIPDTQKKIEGIRIPHWGKILKMAAGTYKMTSLGYLGADIVIDQKRGPLLLELNARPGLSIQVANQVGLRTVLV